MLGLCLDCPQTVLGLSSDCPWTVLRLSLDCLQTAQTLLRLLRLSSDYMGESKVLLVPGVDKKKGGLVHAMQSNGPHPQVSNSYEMLSK